MRNKRIRKNWRRIMDKMDMQTPNMADEKLKKLIEIFPNIVTETIDEDGNVVRAIDKDILMQEISSKVVEGREERYQFTWPDKKQSILAANAPISKTLRPYREESKNFDTTENLYIEGDNLEVLKLLQETYLGKIKMIYTDPPYNTGNDFVYNDDFKQTTDEYLEDSGQFDEEGNRLFENKESNGRFHTDWLNMIYPRLKLARNLLSDDGVIFISIDDNEQANLKKVCNEVFGEENIVADGAIIVKTEGRRYGAFAKSHDYFLGYAKNIDLCDLNEITVEGKDFKYEDEYGGFNIQDLRNQNTKAFNSTNRPNLRYPFYVNTNDKDEFGFYKISLESVEGWQEVYPIVIDGIKSVWRWGSKDGEKARTNTHNICARKGSDGVIRIFEKMRSITQIPKTVLINKKYLTNSGTVEINELFGEKVFDFPKPVGLVKDFSTIGSKRDSIILDFFSGSATTAHAVMQLNAEDGGNRKYIMVQLPEETDEKSEAYKAGYKNICEIGKERIRRAGEKILEENKDKENIDKLDVGFRVLKTDTSNMKDVYYSPENTEQSFLDNLEDNIEEDRTQEDLLFQVMLDLGIPLSSNIEVEQIEDAKVFKVEDRFLIACFDGSISDEVVKQIADMKPFYAVFRDMSMKNDSVAVNFEQIFESVSPETIRKVL